MEEYREMLGKRDTDRWYWLGRAAAKGRPLSFILQFGMFVSSFQHADATLAPVVYSIGRALKGQIRSRFLCFGEPVDSCHLAQAAFAIDFFSIQHLGAQNAVHMWCVIARRLGIVKDVRLRIGRMIWDTRYLGVYPGKQKSGCVLQ